MEKPKSDSISSLEGMSDEDQEGNSDGDNTSNGIKVEYHEYDAQSNSNTSFEPPSKRVKIEKSSSSVKSGGQ
jgi:hypothetical protein